MSLTLAGALLTAGVLGVTHAIEPDHVAGISSLTSRYGDARLSAVVGACFSVGHVVLVVAWLAVGYVVLGRTSYPAVFDTVGTLGVAVVLGVLGTVMAVSGLRSAIHTHRHEHDSEVHSHTHVHLPLLGDADHGHGDESASDYLQKAPTAGHTHGDHDHGHGVTSYLKTGLVGALFTLSPPLSMIAFSATLFPNLGADAVALAVVAYAISITATMSAIGAGVGAIVGVVALSPRVQGTVRALGGGLVVAFAGLLLIDALPAIA
jgi:hypothetical protein